MTAPERDRPGEPAAHAHAQQPLVVGALVAGQAVGQARALGAARLVQDGGDHAVGDAPFGGDRGARQAGVEVGDDAGAAALAEAPSLGRELGEPPRRGGDLGLDVDQRAERVHALLINSGFPFCQLTMRWKLLTGQARIYACRNSATPSAPRARPGA
jgi:hypothetical protein